MDRTLKAFVQLKIKTWGEGIIIESTALPPTHIPLIPTKRKEKRGEERRKKRGKGHQTWA